MRVKICGITRREDAQVVADSGADALGLVFYDPSPRCVDLETARDICQLVGPFVSVVGLFVDASPARIEQVLNRVPLHVLQFHGDETEADCARYGRPFVKALRMKPGLQVKRQIDSYPSATGILLDAYRAGVPGGTGESFDWGRVPQTSRLSLILAGGLNPDNVRAAIAATGVYGVDVSGGVESAPGIKDSEKIQAFVQRARSARVETQ